MKKILTFILLCTITLFLSANQVVVTQNYNFIVTNQSTFNFSTGALTSDVKYQRTNKIAITNDKVLADPLKYHYAFFWDEADTYLGYYKTNRGITTSGTFLGQVNTQNIPLPLNAYSFALVRYDNDYVLVGDYTIKDLFIDNNLDYENLPDFNDISIPELNDLTLNEVFDTGNLISNHDFTNGTTGWSAVASTHSVSSNILTNTGNGTGVLPTSNTSLIPYVQNEVLYVLSRLRTTSTVTSFLQIRVEASGMSPLLVLQATPVQNQWYNLSNVITQTSGGSGNLTFRVGHSYSTSGDANGQSIEVDYTYALNLTNLGIANLTKTQMDRYYELYTNPIHWIYYATDGNVSSRDNHYYAASKNLVDINDTFDSGRIDTSNGLLERAATNIFTSNNILNFTTTQTSGVTSQFLNVLPNTNYYSEFDVVSGGTVYHRSIAFYDNNFNYISFYNNPSAVNVIQFLTPSNAYYIKFDLNVIGAQTARLTNLQLEQGTTGTTYEAYAAPTDLLNLTLLFGVGNEPDLATMDGYYAAYEEYLDYSFVLPLTFANQTLSYEEFYFDDGVSTEIERLGSILIFTLIGFTLMIFGFVSNRRIFNLLAVGAFLVLGFLLIEFVGFIIILFGLIFVNVYYTFFGEL